MKDGKLPLALDAQILPSSVPWHSSLISSVRYGTLPVSAVGRASERGQLLSSTRRRQTSETLSLVLAADPVAGEGAGAVRDGAAAREVRAARCQALLVMQRLVRLALGQQVARQVSARVGHDQQRGRKRNDAGQRLRGGAWRVSVAQECMSACCQNTAASAVPAQTQLTAPEQAAAAWCNCQARAGGSQARGHARIEDGDGMAKTAAPAPLPRISATRQRRTACRQLPRHATVARCGVPARRKGVQYRQVSLFRAPMRRTWRRLALASHTAAVRACARTRTAAFCATGALQRSKRPRRVSTGCEQSATSLQPQAAHPTKEVAKDAIAMSRWVRRKVSYDKIAKSEISQRSRAPLDL